jgi:ubiquinone biosynthesis protein
MGVCILNTCLAAAFLILGVEAVSNNQHQAKSNQINFARRSIRVVQVLYRRGLLKEGLAHLPKALLGAAYGRADRKPAVFTQADLFRADRANKLNHLCGNLGAKNQSWPEGRTLARRLRQAFEDLGPTFIKLGQALSTRPDMVSREVVEEMSLLLDQVQPFSREWVDKIISAELGDLPGRVFKEFNYEPLASASIAQVHRAALVTGEEVVIKIQRPRLMEDIDQDIGVLRFLQPFLQRTMLGKMCNIGQVMDAFTRQIKNEMDFTAEALNLQTFAQVLNPERQIKVPGVYWEYTTKKVLTLDYMEGVKLEEFLAANPDLPARRALGKKLLTAVLEPFFQHGVFHGDPHPGNLLVSGDGRLVLLDYGIVGRLDEEFRFQAALLLTALKKFDTMGMMAVICTLGEVTKPLNNHLFYEDASQLMGLVQGVNKGEVPISKVIYGMIDMAVNHGIYLPAAFYLFGKALVTAEAVVRQMDQSFNLIDEIYHLAGEHLAQEFNLNNKQDQLFMSSLAVFRRQHQWPKLMANLVANISEGKHQLIFAHRGLEPVADAIKESSRRLWSALVIVGLLVSGSLGASLGTSFLQVALGGAGIGLAALMLLKNLRQ